MRWGKAGCSESCPSGLEGAGRRPTRVSAHGAALPPYATHLLEDDDAIRTVQQLLAHADARTTMISTPRPDDRRCRITAVLSVDRR